MSRHATYVFSGGAGDFFRGEIVTRSVAARSEIHEMTATILIVTVVFYIY